MEKDQLQQLQKDGQVEEIKIEQPANNQIPEGKPLDIQQFIDVLEKIRVIKKHRTSAPTNIPMTFWGQFEFYDDGVNRRIYIYINGNWRYVSLT